MRDHAPSFIWWVSSGVRMFVYWSIDGRRIYWSVKLYVIMPDALTGCFESSVGEKRA